MASPRIRSTSPVCWTRHTVLGGMAGVIGVGLLGFVVTTGLRGNPAEVADGCALLRDRRGRAARTRPDLEWLLEM